ncbi:MAG TPA: nucleotidyltransferase [Opitutaceae bacterium]|nr:nucleotidyltransferase [Opitutaceae bacterium]
MTLNKHFREFIELLEKHGASFLIVGGYAVGFHGFPRYTGDLDVFVAISEENAERLVRVMAEFGFGDIGLTSRDFLDPETIIEIGREPIKIQLLTGIDGVAFERCLQHRVEFNDAGLRIPFISLDDLIENKAASPRPKDRIDLEELKRLRDQDSSGPQPAGD